MDSASSGSFRKRYSSALERAASIPSAEISFNLNSIAPSCSCFFATFVAFLCMLCGQKLLTAKIAKKGRKVRQENNGSFFKLLGSFAPAATPDHRTHPPLAL